MNKTLVKKSDIQRLGFPENTASGIIKTAKLKLIDAGYSIYDNKKQVGVPYETVENILGTALSPQNFVTAKDLQEQGFSKTSSQQIIKVVKLRLVQDGFDFYSNRRLGCVPRITVEKFTGSRSDGGGVSNA